MSAALRAPLTWRASLPIVGGLLALVAVTNRWMSWDRGIDHAGATDQHSYMIIVRAYPGLPDAPMADQHADRWVLHWLVAALADLTGSSPETVYRWAALALVVAICLALAAVLIRVGASAATSALALAVLVLNPYALRFYGFAPGYLADLAFELGAAILLLGLLRRALPLVVAGLVIGVVARQTMLLVVPAAVLWIVFDPAWRAYASTGASRWLRAGIAVAATVFAYVIVTSVAGSFSEPGYPLSRLTILDTLMDLPATAGDMVNHFGHVAIVLLAIGALLVAALLRTGPRSLPFAFWGSLAIGAIVVAQALVLNPDPVSYDYSSSNEPRLTAMGLGPLLIAFAIARATTERESGDALRYAPALAATCVALLAVGSLHQTYTVVSTGSAAATLALQMLIAAGLFAAVRVADRRAATVPLDPAAST